MPDQMKPARVEGYKEIFLVNSNQGVEVTFTQEESEALDTLVSIIEANSKTSTFESFKTKTINKKSLFQYFLDTSYGQDMSLDVEREKREIVELLRQTDKGSLAYTAVVKKAGEVTRENL